MDTEIIIKRVLQVVCSLLVLVLVGVLVWELQNEKKAEEEYTNKYVESLPLREQKKELAQKLAQVEREYQVKIKGKGTLTLLGMDLTEDIYTVIYPRLEEKGYIAMLAVSLEALPGREGCMNTTQLNKLLEEGWCLCLHWNGEKELESWLMAMQKELEEQGLKMPGQIYFERETYDTKYDELLSEYGLEAVVHHQEEGLPALITKTEEGIWHIGAWGWNQTNARKSMEKALVDGAGLVFTIGAKYYYDEEQFDSMLTVLSEYEAAERLYVTDVAAAYSYRGETEAAREVLQKELETQKKELEAKIEALNKQMLEIFGESYDI